MFDEIGRIFKDYYFNINTYIIILPFLCIIIGVETFAEHSIIHIILEKFQNLLPYL
jgi:hypothetical protein